MSIRTRIWCTLLLVVVLPVGVCLYLMGRVAYDNAIQRAESVHCERARVTSKSLDAHINTRIKFQIDRMVASSWLREVREASYHDKLEEKRAEAREHWQELKGRDDPRMAWFYHGLLSYEFACVQPYHAELKGFLVVDRKGRPMGGTEKPQAYDQSQEEWFKALNEANAPDVMMRWAREGAHPGPRRFEAWIKARDVEIKLSEDQINAYLKMDFEFTPLFQDYLNAMVGKEFDGVLTDEVGKVVASNGAFSQFAIGERLPPEWLPQAGANQPTMVPLKVASRKQPELIYLVSRSTLNDAEKQDPPRVYVFQGTPMMSVIEPLRKTRWQLFGGTFLVISIAAIAASFYMRRTISRPIEQIARMTKQLTAHAQYGQVLEENEVEQLVAPLREVSTHDELNTLANEFSKLSVKALGFQRDLEHEVEEKTKWLQSDLEMAREFQQALLPHACPECGCTQCHNPLSLEVAHFYQPAAFVSGDFYDYIPVNGHQIAVLIGDVMGHGARSALVTAILRALIEDIRNTHTEPAAFLTELNQRYHEIIERSGQMVFVSACYLLFDTQAGVVHGASAGHPPPLRAQRNGGGVEHLLPESKPRFPLGMMEGVQYKEATVQLTSGDLILLYTDGITEAESDGGQQFGEDALSDQVAAHVTARPEELVQDVAELVQSHAMGSMQDDVCMVAIRVRHTAA